ncbi:MAG: FAD-dependent oxidoreductase [Phycisphaerales bacterium]|nr:FAD-dependent oxidoreductase [Phycisphaerales bacterium]
MPAPLDTLILGGGIAGLWTLRTLLDAGFDAALVETATLGAGQTIASQGIIHAGTKYALSGQAAEAARAAGDAAAIWRGCLAGRGPIDLEGARTLSMHTYLFTTPGVGSRLTGLAASKALAVGPRKLARSEYPAAFAQAPTGVDVYELDEPVFDTPGLLRQLAEPVAERLVRADELRVNAGETPTVSLSTGGRAMDLAPRSIVLTAGAGNEALLTSLGLESEIRMQRRPLHMVMLRGPTLPQLFAHCVSLSDKPRATITSTADRHGRTVWYVGGQIAESGVVRSREEQIAFARSELAAVAPWVDRDRTEWATLRVDRAEGFDHEGRRPNTPVVHRQGRVIACWPTKLVLAPVAAGEVLRALRGIEPSRATGGVIDWPRPSVADSPWDAENVTWS